MKRLAFGAVCLCWASAASAQQTCPQLWTILQTKTTAVENGSVMDAPNNLVSLVSAEGAFEAAGCIGTVPPPPPPPPPPPVASCGMQLGTGTAAFCETFDVPFPVNSRAGQLDSKIWGVSRAMGGGNNFGQSQYNNWPSTTLQKCDGTAPIVIPPNDVVVCNGQLREAVNDNLTRTLDAGDVTVLAMYPKQPFDFAGRTGTISFDVSNDTHGIHAAWPEVWVTDLPVPAPFAHFTSWQAVSKDGFGVRFAAHADPGQFGYCPSFPQTNRWTVDSAIVTRNYVSEDTANGPQPTLTVTPLECVTQPTGPGQLNHVELKVNQSQIEVYASDAGTVTPLKLIARITGLNLGITRGLVWLEDVHYNADKGGLPSQREHTFAWDNLAFDGPYTYKDRSYDALDALTPMPNGSVNLGKVSNPGQTATWNVLNMPASPTATAVRVLFNAFHYDHPVNFTVTVNGHAHLTAWPFPDMQGFTWRTMAVTIPISDLVTGTNVVKLGSPDQPLVTSNVNIVLVNTTVP